MEIAPAIMPFLIFTQSLTTGYYLKFENLPVYFRPFYYVSIFRLTFQGFCYNEFTDMPDLNCRDPLKCVNPLNDFEDSFEMSMFLLVLFAVVYNVLSIVSLVIKRYIRRAKIDY